MDPNKVSQQIDKMQLSSLTIFQVLAFSFEVGIDHLHDYASGTLFLSTYFQRIEILWHVRDIKKNETTNSPIPPIHEFKVLQKGLQAF